MVDEKLILAADTPEVVIVTEEPNVTGPFNEIAPELVDVRLLFNAMAELVMPIAPVVVIAPLMVVVPVPAAWVKLAALTVDEKVTFLAEFMVMAPKGP